MPLPEARVERIRGQLFSDRSPTFRRGQIGAWREQLDEELLESFERITDRSRATLWLNPEPQRFWDTGDSVMSRYSVACDSVDQVRTLRQLEAFVERATLPVHR
jgi:uncharacterized protein with von Willebrand factor type A (vWA) domain